jgi:type IV secretory pathway VirB10-like protein
MRWRRAALFIAIVAAHVLVIWLFPSDRTRRDEPEEVSFATIFLPERKMEQPPTPQSRGQGRAGRTKAPQMVPRDNAVPVSSAPQPTQPQSTAPQQIDWSEEARRVAQAAANNAAASRGSPRPDYATPSGIWPAPSHHAGEQWQLSNGDWMVWVSSRCYQISKSIPAPGGASGHSLPETVCPQSNDPRGDLFKELPEYKKNHPDP